MSESVDKFEEIVRFIRELYNEPAAPVPLHAPVFHGNEKKYLNECIDSTFVSSVGRFVDLFEEKIAAFTGAGRAVACVNGTSALHLALRMVGVDRDTEVITQPLTFIATANAIAYCGAYPVFLDVDMDTMGLSPDSLKRWLCSSTQQRNKTTNRPETINKKTGRCIKACVPMHTFGHPCRIDEIVEICHEYHIEVVEDAAESIGSYYKRQHTGTFGKIGVLSFNGNKTITTGGGGMLLFKDKELGQLAKHLSTQAKIPHPWEFVHDAIGYNYRMPNINAALGVAQLEQLETFLKTKRDLAEKYRHFFDKKDIRFVVEPANARSNYWLNCILLKNKQERDDFLEYSNSHKVMTRPAWQLMNKLPMFGQCQADELKNAGNLAEHLVNIPSSVII